jgi:hypothetical protein
VCGFSVKIGFIFEGWRKENRRQQRKQRREKLFCSVLSVASRLAKIYSFET